MNVNLTPIIGAVVTLLSALISAFLIPYIKRNTTKKELEEFDFWVKIGVQAAEQVFSSEQAKEKKEYVLNFLTDKGYDVDFADINNIIEAEVLKLHAELYGAEK